MICAVAIPASVSVLSSASQTDCMASGESSGATRGDPNDTTRSDWRKTDARCAPNGADRKPVLFQMLAYNDKMNTDIDENRLDAVVRVAHGEVSATTDPNGNPLHSLSPSGDTGLRMKYNYINNRVSGDTIGEDFSTNQGKNKSDEGILYAPTSVGRDGANVWAANQHEYFTIHKIIHSGLYDYLTISFVADEDYPNRDTGYGAGWWKSTTKEGRLTDAAQVYLTVGPAAYDVSGYPLKSTADFQDYQANHHDLTTNIMAGYKVHLFPDCDGDETNKDYLPACNVPSLYMSYNDQPKKLWTANQSNWGLVADYGLGGSFYSPLEDSKGNHDQVRNGDKTRSTSSLTPTAEGVAPWASFNIAWYTDNKSRSWVTNPAHSCNTYSSYWWQWVELKNNDQWVPVTSLTGTSAQLATGQALAREHSGAPNLPADSDDGTVNKVFAYNENPKDGKTDNLFYQSTTGMNQAGGPMQPAQDSEGNINFKMAKTEDPGNGYFKLISWPNVDASGCGVPDQTNSTGNPGITLDMTKEQAQAQVDKGWVNNTAFYKYDVTRPKVPTITGVSKTNAKAGDYLGFNAITDSSDPQYPLADNKSSDFSAADAPTIKGMGTPNQLISLFEDVPNSTGTFNDTDHTKKNILQKGVLDEYGDTGHLIGTARVPTTCPEVTQEDPEIPQCPWSISVPNNSSDIDYVDRTNPIERVRRYHAYQTDTTTEMNHLKMDLSSYFTPLDLVNFSAPADKAPTITSVEVPHTQHTATLDGALTDGNDTKVTISGKMSSTEGDSSMKLYAIHTDPPTGQARSKKSVKSTRSAVATRGGTGLGTEIPGTTSASCEQTVGEGDDQSWTCKTPVSWFITNTPTPVGGQGCYFKFVAVTTNKDGVSAESTPLTTSVDFYAPVVTITSADNTWVKGKVTSDPNTPVIASSIVKADETHPAKVYLSWPAGTPSTAPSSVDVDTNGDWQAAVPLGAKAGTITAYATDNETNASKKVLKKDFNPTPPAFKLPFTGNFPWWTIVIAVAAVAVSIIGYQGMKQYRRGLLGKGLLTCKGRHAK